MMKPWIVISLLGTFPVAASPPMRDATTPEQLEQRYRKAFEKDPNYRMAPKPEVDPKNDQGKQAEPVKPAEPEKPASLISQSDIICFNGVATLVPKRAIIQIPEKLTSRLQYQPGAKLMNWKEFYALNRGWITTIEVSQVQAEGNSPLPEDTQKKLVKSGNLIVATYRGGPISVLPLKVPAEETAASKTPSKP